MQAEPMPSITLREYLSTCPGIQLLDLLAVEVSRTGRMPASETGLKHSMLDALLDILVYVSGNADSIHNIRLSREIMDEPPERVLRAILNWTTLDYAPLILPQCFDDEQSVEQVGYAFDPWTHRDGEPIRFAQDF